MRKFRFALADNSTREIEAESFRIDAGQLEFYAAGQLIAVFAKEFWLSCEVATDKGPVKATAKNSK